MEIKTLNGQRRWSVCNFDRFKFESFDSVERQNVAWQITAYFHSISSVFIFLPKCLSFLFSLRLLLPLPGQRNRWRRRRRREKKGWKTPSKPTQMAAILLLLTDIKFVEKSAFFPSTFRIRKKWLLSWYVEKKISEGCLKLKWNETRDGQLKPMLPGEKSNYKGKWEKKGGRLICWVGQRQPFVTLDKAQWGSSNLCCWTQFGLTICYLKTPEAPTWLCNLTAWFNIA